MIYPWSQLTLNDPHFNSSNGFPPRKVYVEAVDFLPGLAGESRNFDANGPYIRILGALGQTGVTSLQSGLVGGTLAPLVGFQPTVPPGGQDPPLQPTVPCETQPPVRDLTAGSEGAPPALTGASTLPPAGRSACCRCRSCRFGLGLGRTRGRAGLEGDQDVDAQVIAQARKELPRATPLCA